MLSSLNFGFPEFVGGHGGFTGVGRNFASKFWNSFQARFPLIFGIICVSGVYQDLPPGFYQVFTLDS